MSEDPLARQTDIRPAIAGKSSNRAVWMFAGGAGIAAVALFTALETRRETITAPAIGPVSGQSDGTIAPPPALMIPTAPPAGPPASWLPYSYQGAAAQVSDQGEARLAVVGREGHVRPTPAGPRAPRVIMVPQSPVYSPAPYVPPAPSQSGYGASPPRPVTAERGGESGNQPDRVRASIFANPATTVPKGTLIAGVLETALDSTRTGYARAIVSRDVVGFDGSRVLIPRGSRLVGEYKADLAPGQKRALIQWQRLMRPDGAIINLDSPAADPLGRAGVEGQVNSHFFERFGGAILQSVLNIGTQVATNRISDGGVVVAIPLGQAVPAPSPDRVQPTLKVRQGKSISVFVAKDLDFTSVER